MTQDNQGQAEFDAYRHTYNDVVEASFGLRGVKVDYPTEVKAGYLVDLVTNHFGIAESKTLLDVGCGIGNVHKRIQENGLTVTGVDVSSECIAQAKLNNPNIGYDSYDGAVLPYADNSFDCAATTCVMHHVPPSQWPSFTREMFRVLKPGGLAMIFEHNPFNPLTRRIVNRCPFDADAVLLRPSETTALLQQAGFHPVKVRSILTVPAKSSAMRSLDRLFGRLHIGAQYFAIGTKPHQ